MEYLPRFGPNLNVGKYTSLMDPFGDDDEIAIPWDDDEDPWNESLNNQLHIHLYHVGIYRIPIPFENKSWEKYILQERFVDTPPNGEVGKIIDSKSAFAGGICDRSQEATLRVAPKTLKNSGYRYNLLIL